MGGTCGTQREEDTRVQGLEENLTEVTTWKTKAKMGEYCRNES